MSEQLSGRRVVADCSALFSHSESDSGLTGSGLRSCFAMVFLWPSRHCLDAATPSPLSLVRRPSCLPGHLPPMAVITVPQSAIIHLTPLSRVSPASAPWGLPQQGACLYHPLIARTAQVDRGRFLSGTPSVSPDGTPMLNLKITKASCRGKYASGVTAPGQGPPPSPP